MFRGEHELAAQSLKRASFMLRRAHRPSPAGRACLLNVHGLLHEARGQYAEAIDAHQESHRLLLSVTDAGGVSGGGAAGSTAAAGPAAASRWPRGAEVTGPRSAGWLHAARTGSAWAMLRSGGRGLAAADAIAHADLAADRLHTLDLRERAYARSLAAVTTLQRLSEASATTAVDGIRSSAIDSVGTGDGEHAGGVRRRHDEMHRAISMLRETEGALTTLLGPEHVEVHGARQNLRVAHEALAVAPSGAPGDGACGDALPLAWHRHWQPAIGAALGSGVRSAAHTTSSPSSRLSGLSLRA